MDIISSNKIIFISIFFLAAISLVALLSVSISQGDFFYVNRQIIWFIAGFAGMILISFFGDWRLLKDNRFSAIYIYIFSIILLIVALFSSPVRGIKGWIDLGFFSIQPAELAKLSLIIIMAKYFSRRHVEIWRIRHIFISAIYFLIPAILLILEPDLGSVIILGIIWFFTIIISGIKLKHFLFILAAIIIILIFGWIYVLAPYQKDRITSFIFPNTDPLGAGYQIAQSKISIGSGGLLGRGVGRGIETQYGLLPERHADFIFASFAEEWGFVGICVVVLLYIFLFIGIRNIGKQVKNNFSVFFIFGYSVMILSQIFINIGGNLGFLPITGISLPFLSYGGSNLIINFIGLGIVLNMGQKTAFLAPKKSDLV